MLPPVRIAASILAADFACLGEEVAGISQQVDMLHIDVMDGHFVPNISLGIPVIRSLRAACSLPFDCHLMITHPHRYFEALRQAGADSVSVHLEVVADPTEAARQARALGLGFGVVVNPDTSFSAMDPFLELCDLAVVMSVQPGFGGQAFRSEVLTKAEKARAAIEFRGLQTALEIDGGIDRGTIRLARLAGVDLFVAGTSIFRQPDPAAAAMQLRQAAEPD